MAKGQLQQFGDAYLPLSQQQQSSNLSREQVRQETSPPQARPVCWTTMANDGLCAAPTVRVQLNNKAPKEPMPRGFFHGLKITRESDAAQAAGASDSATHTGFVAASTPYVTSQVI